MLAIAAVLFTEAALSDFFYSDCLSVGTPALSCTNGAAILQPLVVNGRYWYLNPFVLPGSSIAEAMGKVAGISFLWIFAAFFLLRANRLNGRSLKEVAKALVQAVVFNSVIYMLFMIGVVLFIPYCLPGSCRISNEIPWLNYIQGFSIATIGLSSYILVQIWRRIFALRREVLRKRILERDILQLAALEAERSPGPES
jgi:hypothetical protein